MASGWNVFVVKYLDRRHEATGNRSLGGFFLRLHKSPPAASFGEQRSPNKQQQQTWLASAAATMICWSLPVCSIAITATTTTIIIIVIIIVAGAIFRRRSNGWFARRLTHRGPSDMVLSLLVQITRSQRRRPPRTADVNGDSGRNATVTSAHTIFPPCAAHNAPARRGGKTGPKPSIVVAVALPARLSACLLVWPGSSRQEQRPTCAGRHQCTQ